MRAFLATLVVILTVFVAVDVVRKQGPTVACRLSGGYYVSSDLDPGTCYPGRR
jgi:hypothetical protein